MLTFTIRKMLLPGTWTVRRIARRLFAVVLEWQERANQRHLLYGLSDHSLKDIGLSRADVEREASKPFWIL